MLFPEPLHYSCTGKCLRLFGDAKPLRIQGLGTLMPATLK